LKKNALQAQQVKTLISNQKKSDANGCETLSSTAAPHTFTRLGVKLVQNRQEPKRRTRQHNGQERGGIKRCASRWIQC
jgi:hypothetical protein